MKKIILLILDGLGLSENENGNAVKAAKTKGLDEIMAKYPCAELEASGEEVGLPKGQMGNSEVGHMTIGTGRVTLQPLSLINEKIKNKELFSNEFLKEKFKKVRESGSTLHIMGLLSDGGVHSSINHFYAILAMAKIEDIKNVSFHIVTDGRDVLPKSALTTVKEFAEKCKKLGLGTISTISGRYYAMDRDNRWERVKRYYDIITTGYGNSFRTPEYAIDMHYQKGVTDEFINPSFILDGKIIKEGDSVLFMNFRPDRMKELINAFTDPNFNAFPVKKYKNVDFYSLYDIHKNIESVYKQKEITNTFGEYIAKLDFKQARIAETEKYNHVTHFFDGEKDLENKNYFKFLVPSPTVATYDQKPEMSVGEVTENTLKAIEDDYDFILVNFANPDMVGHTGNFKATVDAVEICDFCLGKILEKAEEHFYDLVVTADHGNAEQMIDKDGNVLTSHTTNKVPFIICNTKYKLKPEGSLKDIIPTLIDMYEITKPEEMTGESLIVKEE